MTPEQAAQLRAPFPPDEIELLPKPYRKDAEKGKCKECDGFHGLPAVHLSYVGHAGVTMRLLEVDPDWDWEPMASTEIGTPLFTDGGLWIRLTVCGKTRLGFGDAAGKSGPNAVKEVIGDAIRNAAMRFGVGTYLWSKSEKAQALAERHGAEADPTPPPPPQQRQERPPPAPQQPARQRPDGPAGQDVPITKNPKLFKRLQITFKTYGITEHDARVAYAAAVIGHDLASTNDLTVGEGSRVLQRLEHELGQGTDVTPPEPGDPDDPWTGDQP